MNCLNKVNYNFNFFYFSEWICDMKSLFLKVQLFHAGHENGILSIITKNRHANYRIIIFFLSLV